MVQRSRNSTTTTSPTRKCLACVPSLLVCLFVAHKNVQTPGPQPHCNPTHPTCNTNFLKSLAWQVPSLLCASKQVQGRWSVVCHNSKKGIVTDTWKNKELGAWESKTSDLTDSQRFFRQTQHARAHTNKQIGDSNKVGRGGGASAIAAEDLGLQNSHNKHAQVWNKSLVARKIASQETLPFSNNKQLAS
jgi:hypothetical protein